MNMMGSMSHYILGSVMSSLGFFLFQGPLQNKICNSGGQTRLRKKDASLAIRSPK